MVPTCPPQHMLMSTVAEWGVRAHFAVAQFKIATFWDVESDRTAPGDDPFTLAITEGRSFSVPAWTPVVRFASMQVHMCWINTCQSWQTWWPVFSFLIRSTFSKRNNSLFGEICYIVHRDSFSGGRWLQDHRFWGKNISFVSFDMVTSKDLKGENGSLIVTYSTLT